MKLPMKPGAKSIEVERRWILPRNSVPSQLSIPARNMWRALAADHLAMGLNAH